LLMPMGKEWYLPFSQCLTINILLWNLSGEKRSFLLRIWVVNEKLNKVVSFTKKKNRFSKQFL
jgi:hypothetical protein